MAKKWVNFAQTVEKELQFSPGRFWPFSFLFERDVIRRCKIQVPLIGSWNNFILGQ